MSHGLPFDRWQDVVARGKRDDFHGFRAVYVGLAVWKPRLDRDDTATFTNVAVSTAGSGGNASPTVAITSPSSGATYTAPASMTLPPRPAIPMARWHGWSIYLGSVLLKSDSRFRTRWPWDGVAAGTYQLTAVARDNDGSTRTSSAVTITVNAGTTTRPTKVVFVPSSNHATSVTSYTVAVYRASDPVTASPVATGTSGSRRW